jgi:hypothetical protein
VLDLGDGSLVNDARMLIRVTKLDVGERVGFGMSGCVRRAAAVALVIVSLGSAQVQRDGVTVRLMFIPSRLLSQRDNVSVEESAFWATLCRPQQWRYLGVHVQ